MSKCIINRVRFSVNKSGYSWLRIFCMVMVIVVLLWFGVFDIISGILILVYLVINIFMINKFRIEVFLVSFCSIFLLRFLMMLIFLVKLYCRLNYFRVRCMELKDKKKRIGFSILLFNVSEVFRVVVMGCKVF